MQAGSNAISRLPLQDVDREAVNYGADLVYVLDQLSSVFSDMANLIDEAAALGEHSTSLEAGAESFIRGYFGDPMGKFNEMNARSSQLESRRQQLMSRLTQVQSQAATLQSREMRLRATLTEEYGGDFPPLSSAVAPLDTSVPDNAEAKDEKGSGNIGRRLFSFVYDKFGIVGVVLLVVVIIALIRGK